MPDKLIEGVPKQSLTKQEQKQVKELKAKLAKIEAKTTDKPPDKPDEKPTYTKQVSEERMGKCPVCDLYHYYISKGSKTKVKILTSSFLTGCPKYMAANVDNRLNMIVSNKACAACMDWRHERSACHFKKQKPCWE